MKAYFVIFFFPFRQGKEFTPFYQIRYQREENNVWITYKDIEKRTVRNWAGKQKGLWRGNVEFFPKV